MRGRTAGGLSLSLEGRPDLAARCSLSLSLSLRVVGGATPATPAKKCARPG